MSDMERIQQVVIDGLSAGKSLRSICENDDSLPSECTIRRWALNLDGTHSEFATQYARARELQSERFADELIDIADGVGLEPGTVLDPQMVRLRLDARKWVISKILPKKYGDKLDVTSKGDAVQVAVYIPANGRDSDGSE